MTRRRIIAAVMTAGLAFPACLGSSLGSSAWATCGTTAIGDWSNNCTTYWNQYKDSNYTVAIQRVLKQLGYYTATVDGDYGTATQAAVTQFQKDNGLSADGEVGPNTWKKLHSKVAATGSTMCSYYNAYALSTGGTIFVGESQTDQVWIVRAVNQHANDCLFSGVYFTVMNTSAP